MTFAFAVALPFDVRLFVENIGWFQLTLTDVVSSISLCGAGLEHAVSTSAPAATAAAAALIRLIFNVPPVKVAPTRPRAAWADLLGRPERGRRAVPPWMGQR
jgi:hypothetical protein